MMKSIKPAVMVVVLGATLPAFAMGQQAKEVDANGDGILSVAEVQLVYPDVTNEQFSAMDINADGALDQAELAAAQEAGMLPAAPTDG